jgi:hypothetical protein
MAKYYSTTLEEAEDGSGDVVIPFPEDFLKEEEWFEGDEITFKVKGESLVLINKTKELRDRVKQKNQSEDI